MNFAFTEEQEALRRTARTFLADHSTPALVRAAMESERGYDPAVWRRVGAELGWTAILVPEAYGGLGLGYVELVALMEELGGALLCAPFFSTVCCASFLSMSETTTSGLCRRQVAGDRRGVTIRRGARARFPHARSCLEGGQ